MCFSSDVIHGFIILLAEVPPKAEESELPKLTEEEQKKYKDFWGRFKSKSNQSLEHLACLYGSEVLY